MDFEVQVGARRPAVVTDRANDLPGGDGVADLHLNFVHVLVQVGGVEDSAVGLRVLDLHVGARARVLRDLLDDAAVYMSMPSWASSWPDTGEIRIVKGEVTV